MDAGTAVFWVAWLILYVAILLYEWRLPPSNLRTWAIVASAAFPVFAIPVVLVVAGHRYVRG